MKSPAQTSKKSDKRNLRHHQHAGKTRFANAAGRGATLFLQHRGRRESDARRAGSTPKTTPVRIGNNMVASQHHAIHVNIQLTGKFVGGTN